MEEKDLGFAIKGLGRGINDLLFQENDLLFGIKDLGFTIKGLGKGINDLGNDKRHPENIITFHV